MANYKLTYFDIDGARGEPARIAFHSAGIDFEDNRVPFDVFFKSQASYPFHAVPTLEIDGEIITQSNAINRYVGKLAGLYPENAMQALYCDEAMDVPEDIMHHTVRTFGLQGDELKEARQKLVDGKLSVFVKGMGELLGRRGGSYFADGRLTMADLKVFVWIRSLRSGTLDHVPKDLVDTLAANLAEHQQRIAEDDRVVAYYAR